MCARPPSPRHAQPDWMGGGLVSRQMMHAPPSAAIYVQAQAGGGKLRADGEAKVSEGGILRESAPQPTLFGSQPSGGAHLQQVGSNSAY